MQPTGIHVEGVSTWTPLDLDATHQQTVASLVERFGDDAATRDVATGLAGLADRVAREDEGDSFPLALFVRTPDDDTLLPLEVATLRAVSHRGADPREFAEAVTRGADLSSAVEVAALATAAGPATTIRYRSVVTRAAERQVHEDNLVVWFRPHQGYAVVLSVHSPDLVVAASLPDALHRLAEGVHGL